LYRSWRKLVIKLYNESNDALIGEITEDQLKFLVGELEEESLEDVDYYLSEATVNMLEADGADAALIAMLRSALDVHGEVDIKWERT
jgi:processive 1,2-diacylglycerol beta-glucosyltransferase